MAAKVGSLAVLLVIGGCCLTVVSGNDENDAGSTTSGAACVPGPVSDLQTYATYGSNARGAAASGDLNGDGLLDFVAVQTSLMGGGLPDSAAASSDQDSGGLVVLINRGDGGFQTTFYPTVPSLYGQVVLLPHEGAAPDLILGRVEGVGGLEVLKNSGHGTFPTGDFCPIPGGISIAVGDFNGDCIPMWLHPASAIAK